MPGLSQAGLVTRADRGLSVYEGTNAKLLAMCNSGPRTFKSSPRFMPVAAYNSNLADDDAIAFWADDQCLIMLPAPSTQHSSARGLRDRRHPAPSELEYPRVMMSPNRTKKQRRRTTLQKKHFNHLPNRTVFS